jgi:hypothetical protein
MEGKTMTVLNKSAAVIWDFPVMVFKIARDRLAKFFADRDEEEGRWLNG